MSDKSLNLSHISSQSNDEAIEGWTSPKQQHSIENILDELDRKDEVIVTEKSPQIKERRKLRVLKEQELALFPPFNLPFPPKTESTSREKRIIIRAQNRADDIRRPSIEFLHEIEQSSPNTYGTLTDRLETRTSSTTLHAVAKNKRAGSHLLPNENVANTGSNLNDFVLLRSAERLPSIADRTMENQLLSPKKLPDLPQFNVSVPHRPLISNESPNSNRQKPKLNLQTRVASVVSTASNSKTDSPGLTPINKSYLYNIFFADKRGLNEDYLSNSNSPKSASLPAKNDYQLTKAGSFSVFRRVVESELDKKL